jgi:NitT/TauT family transport system permease protein
VLLLWQFLSANSLISPIFYPTPTAVFQRLIKSITTGELLLHGGFTLKRMLSGFLIGGTAGVFVGLALGWSSLVRSILDPIVAALHPVPKLTLLPMFIIIFGIGDTSRIALISISVFFPVMINSMVGVLQISPNYFEVAENYGARKRDVFRKVVLPGSMPLVLTGIRLGLKGALTITIAVEIIFANEGLGSLIWLAWEIFQTDLLFAMVFVMAFLGFGTNWLLQRLKLSLVPWNQEVRY